MKFAHRLPAFFFFFSLSLTSKVCRLNFSANDVMSTTEKEIHGWSTLFHIPIVELNYHQHGILVYKRHRVTSARGRSLRMRPDSYIVL